MKDILKNKEKRYSLLVILVDFALLCSLIYFKLRGNSLGVIISVLGIGLVFSTVYSKYKNTKLFIIPLFGLFLLSNTNVYALTDNEILEQLYQNSLESEYKERIAIKTEEFLAYYTFDLQEGYTPNIYAYDEDDIRIYLIEGNMIESDEYVYHYSTSKYTSDGWLIDCIYLHSPLDGVINGEIVYSTVDILNEDGTVYFKSNLDDNSWGNVPGYTYLTLEPEQQVILQPKVRQIFNFTIYYNGYLDLDFMSDSSDFSNSKHVVLAMLPNDWVKRDDLMYTAEDARYKRVIYVSNSSYYGSSKFGYDSNLFDLYYLTNGKVTINDKEYTGNVSQIQDTYPEGELGISEPLFGGSISDIVDSAPDLATQFIGVFEVIGALFSSFLSFMPPYIQNGLMLLFLAVIVITIIKIVRG